ncbi:MAG TPA: GAF domain-containing protein, partial [Candidatus Methylomirabilis sp.]|nr:GAF domain-containing protein [Candidatus Methylomirabilis sp.]
MTERDDQRDRRTRELEALAESSRLLTATLDPGEVLNRLAGVAQSRLEVDVVRIWLLDDTGELLRLRAQQGVTGDPAPLRNRLSPRESLAGWVITERTPLVLPDVQQDPRLKHRDWFEAEGFVSFLGVPIMLDDSPIGVLACMARARREFAEGDVAVARALTAPTVAAVRNAALHAETVERLEEIQAFQRVVSETLSSPAPETAIRVVVRELQSLLGAEAAVGSLIDPRTHRMRTVTSAGTRGVPITGYTPSSGEGLAGIVFREKRPLRSDDYLADARFTRTPAIEAWARAEGVTALIAAPVLDHAGEVIAFFWAFNRSRTPFTTRHETTLAALAQHAALAIGKAHAFEEERQRARQTAALLDIARACTSTLELTPLLKEIACRTAQALRAERCAIFLWRGGHLAPIMAQFADGHAEPELWARFKALRNQPMEELPAHAEAIRTRRPVLVTRESELLPSEWFERFDVGVALVAPLVSNDEVVGTIGLDARDPRTWQREERMDLAMAIASQVALAVDNARHYEDARQRATEVATLGAIGETLTSTLDLQQVLEAIAAGAASLIGAQRAVVFELDQQAECLRARAMRGIGMEPGFTIRLGQAAAGSAAARLEPVWNDDVLAHPLPGYDELHEPSGLPLRAVIAGQGYRAVLAVPVISRETVLGAVCVYWNHVHRPDEREVRMLSALARQAAVAMENARLVGDLRRTVDDLRTAQETLVRGATLRAVGELAAGAAHHLNNLMAVVLGRTQLLLMKSPEAAVAASLRSVERAAIDAADTVRRIQGFSGTSRGAESTRFDLNAVVQEAVEFTRSRWQNEAKVRGANIEVHTQFGLIAETSGRRLEIREVITNLLLNAVDALPQGGRIAIGTRAEAGRVAVSVSDNGIGMSPDVQRRAFEPFFTTKGVKRTG